jgi:threonylcarbamoyladenosine tRNA methylthiotransferase MtaB
MKIYLDTVGCRLNQAEIERMAREFRAAGHDIVAEAAEADWAIVNTCAVTSEAAADSRSRIRAAARAGAEVFAAGCWATLSPKEASALPGVRQVIPNREKDSLVASLLSIPPESFDLEPIVREPLPGARGRTRAFIKAQDGCNNACAFCVTTIARGAARSRPLEDILEDIHAALAGGAKEIVLTGVHLGSWGQDLGKPLTALGRAVLSETDAPRVRFSSLEPWDIPPEFFELWENPRLCPHLHLPLQSGSDSVLRRMRRHATRESFRKLVETARAAIPDVAITTDVIAGFPGETDAEFEETVSFLREIGFSGGHVFTFSPRPGTLAARMENQLPKAERKARNAILRKVFEELSVSYRRRFLHRTLEVLWETAREKENGIWELRGLTGNYLRVRADFDTPRRNQFDKTRLLQLEENGVRGEIL